jgi:hypothetical protein
MLVGLAPLALTPLGLAPLVGLTTLGLTSTLALAEGVIGDA